MPANRPRLLTFAAALLVAAAGCSDPISHYRVPKDGPAAPAGAPSAGTVMASAEVPPPTGPARGGLSWTLPKGWSETRGGGGMRYATLVAPVGGVDVSVTVLAGDAGGELANVNRWRNQIGLAPLDDAALARARRPVAAPLGPVALYDFTGDGTPRKRVVAGFAQVQGDTWFVKMSGDDGPVGAARPDFVRIVESLRLE